MDALLSEDQEMLKKTARDFLTAKCPSSLVRKLEVSERGYSTELWHEMAELGWLNLTFPERYGGAGGNFMNMALLYEEMGRAALPSPHLSTVMMCGHIILACGSEKQKMEILPQIANGSVFVSLALMEPEAGWDIVSVATHATADRTDYVINGTKLFVAYGHIADYLLCVARIMDKKDEVSPFLIAADNPGLTFTNLKTMGGDKQSEISFSNVRVSKQSIFGEPSKDRDILIKALQPAVVMQCAEMVGVAQKVMELSINYAKQRIQFERPIGTFQAIQHKCADMAKDVEGARIITRAAAWKLSQGIPCTRDVAMAKLYTNTACRRVVWEGHQIHAAVSFMVDHDLQLYSRRAMAAEYRLGDNEFHEQIIAGELGLT